MKTSTLLAVFLAVLSWQAYAQEKWTVSGTPIPPQLLQQNYGKLPRDITAYDLSICNTTDSRQTVVSTQVYQSLAATNLAITPIGRQIILASILRNQNHSLSSVLGVALNSTTAVFGLLSTSRSVNLPLRTATTLGLGSIVLSQILSELKPVLAPDKLEKFDREVLEPALVLDSGSCVERTVFALAPAGNKALPASVRFNMR